MVRSIPEEPASGCPGIDIVERIAEDAPVEAPFEAAALVLAMTELGGAVYTVVASAGRVAAAPPPPDTVVVPVTSLSSWHSVPM